MEKMDMRSMDPTQGYIEQLGKLFPECVTEIKTESGGGGGRKLTLGVDFERLRALLSRPGSEAADGAGIDAAERYQMTWPGKRAALLAANRPSTMTLRPARERSVDFDSTQNLFVEGDNLEALKLLQNSYWGKVKMIYIDPPYNTGNDLVYKDDFSVSQREYEEKSSQRDETGARLATNKESNGRFHSDWLCMIYPRLKLARNLLSDDGVIFISIDEHENHNLRKVCDEIFGAGNFVVELIRKTKSTTNDAKNGVNLQHESCLVYAKLKDESVSLLGGEKDLSRYSNPDNDPNGDWLSDNPSAKSGSKNNLFPIENPYTHKVDLPPVGNYWRFSQKTFKEKVDAGIIVFKKEHGPNERGFIYKRYKNQLKTTKRTLDSLAFCENAFLNQAATKELKKMGLVEYFKYPQGVDFVQTLIEHATDKDQGDVALDFFAGSGTTGHAVMRLNAQDGGNRRFILVQLPEPSGEKAVAAGFADIAQIALERLRRAGKEILESAEATERKPDVGFRCLKVDTSNMADVYYKPDELGRERLAFSVDNVLPDRGEEDLLFQTMQDWGLDLSLPIERETIQGKTVFFVDGDAFCACFDATGSVDESFVKALAARKTLRAVFRDAGFKDSATKINVEQIFRQISPRTEVKCL